MSIPFYVNSDKTATSTVRQAEWSPSRDLLACLTQDCQLHAYRLTNFQRIWALSFESEATTLCWQPDGERIAVGHKDGTVSVIAAENGDTLLQSRILDCPIACLTWTATRLRDPRAVSLAHDMLRRYRRMCPPAAEDSASGMAGPGCTPDLAPLDFEVLNILCSADTAGSICLSAFGHFPLLRISLASLLKVPLTPASTPPPPITPQQLVMQADFSSLAVSYGTATDPVAPGALGVAVCDLRYLRNRAHELHSVLLIACALQVTLERCSRGIEAVASSAAAARSAFHKSFSLYVNDAAAQFDSEFVTPDEQETATWGQDELQELLTRGVAAGPMQIFLTRRPGEHGVKQVARAVDAAYDAAHTSLASSVIDALQRATFLLGELRGLLSSSPTYAALGIELRATTLAEASAAAMLAHSEALRATLTNAATLHRVFFDWVLGCVREQNAAEGRNEPPPQAPGPRERHLVATFLEHHFLSDVLSEQLKTGVQPAPASHQVAKVAPTTRDVMGLMALALGAPAIKADQPLPDTFAKLRSSVDGLFAALPDALSPNVDTMLQVIVSNCSEGQYACTVPSLQLPQAVMHEGGDTEAHNHTHPDGGLLHMCCITCACALRGALPDSALLIRIELAPGSERVERVSGCILEVSMPGDDQTLVDVHSYREGSLVLLTKQGLSASERDEDNDEEGSDDEESVQGEHTGRLVVAHPFKFSDFVTLEGAGLTNCVQTIIDLGGVVQMGSVEGVKMRQTPSGLVNHPMAVSVTRGLAAVCAMQRMTVYDLEDEDQEDEEQEEEDE